MCVCVLVTISVKDFHFWAPRLKTINFKKHGKTGGVVSDLYSFENRDNMKSLPLVPLPPKYGTVVPETSR